jgi:hypothetical protein
MNSVSNACRRSGNPHPLALPSSIYHETQYVKSPACVCVLRSTHLDRAGGHHGHPSLSQRLFPLRSSDVRADRSANASGISSSSELFTATVDRLFNPWSHATRLNHSLTMVCVDQTRSNRNAVRSGHLCKKPSLPQPVFRVPSDSYNMCTFNNTYHLDECSSCRLL